MMKAGAAGRQPAVVVTDAIRGRISLVMQVRVHLTVGKAFSD
jgi:hypothetical protein